VRLGASLARRGPLAVAALAISGATLLAVVVVAVLVARRGEDAPVHRVPVMAATVLAWGGAFLHAVVVAASALRRDRTDGIRHLFVARTTSPRAYLVGRVSGLAVWLAGVVAGGALVTGSIGIVAAARAPAVARIVQSTGAAIAFGVAFAAVLAPVAFAALGARPRRSGYLALLAIVLVPELVVASLAGAVPVEIAELCAIPSALGALRDALSPGTLDLLRAARALAVVVALAAVALVLVRRALLRLEGEQA
jgi:hypothetical protein